MSLKIALILSVLLQFITAFIALSLIRRSRSNIAWWLISLGFLLMAIRRLFELFQVFEDSNNIINSVTNSWLGVFTSILMLLSLSFIKRIFNIQKRLDKLKKDNEARVTSAIIRTEENQKYKFSKELHDGIGPLLSAAKMAISSLIKNSESEKNIKILANTENLIDESISTIKEISNNLSPHVLLNFGMYSALKSFINKLPEADRKRIKLKSNLDERRFDHTIESVVYRVISELIINSLKHAEARNIYIDIYEDQGTIYIKYLDDGVGFDYSEDSEDERGLGLVNIKSRMNSIHGIYSFSSKPGEGFNAIFEIKT